jgi:glycosyltransferase involved in cell wall biosynthesis
LRILHFGNLCRLKGVEVLVEAVRRVVASGRRVDLVLAGKAVEAGLDLEGARVVGPYDATRLRTLAQDADVVVLPSLARESYGLVVDEALRLGLPVIVSDRGALAERIGGRGLAVVAGDVDALAGAISRFADDAAAVASYRAAPLPDLLTPEDHAQSLLVVYRRASDLPRARVDVERPLVNRLRHWGAALSRVMSRPGSRAAGVPKPMPMSASSPIVPRVEVDPAGDLVSVITRTRNRRDFLAESIASVARQTHPRVELVVCNDGGEDVADVLDPFRDRLAITYLEPGRVGRCSAGNIALEHARGTWIAWLDDDDLYYPEHLATLMDTVRTSGHKVAYTDAHQLDMGRAGPDGPWVEVGRSVPYSQDFSRVMLFRQAYIHLVTVLHHRECVERLGGLDPTLEVLEDWDLFFRLAQDYDFKHLARVTAAFRIRDDRSNAVTALRREFVDTRTLLYQRYSHVALPEMLGMVQTGHELIGVLRKRIDDLEARLLPPTEDP